VSERRDTRGRGVRGVIAGIDEQLARVESESQTLGRERERLLAARAALLGQPLGRAPRAKRISQDDVAAYLAEHPGSSPSQIAAALEVPVTNVSTHLYRAKNTRFQRKSDGWYVSSRGGSRAR
jgi:DNA-directed RNA polymerase specialized sigma24 family protein